MRIEYNPPKRGKLVIIRKGPAVIPHPDIDSHHELKVPVDSALVKDLAIERAANSYQETPNPTSSLSLAEPSYLTCGCVVGIREFLDEGSYGIGEQSSRIIAKECKKYPQNIFFRIPDNPQPYSCKEPNSLAGIVQGTNLTISVQERLSKPELALLKSFWREDFLELLKQEIARSAGSLLDMLYTEISSSTGLPDFNRVTQSFL